MSLIVSSLSVNYTKSVFRRWQKVAWFCGYSGDSLGAGNFRMRPEFYRQCEELMVNFNFSRRTCFSSIHNIAYMRFILRHAHVSTLHTRSSTAVQNRNGNDSNRFRNNRLLNQAFVASLRPACRHSGQSPTAVRHR